MRSVQTYSNPLHATSRASFSSHDGNSIDDGRVLDAGGYNNLSGKTKKFTCNWCSTKVEGTAIYRCEHNHMFEKKFCSAECKNYHWSSAHM
jgi:hypothetical protein